MKKRSIVVFFLLLAAAIVIFAAVLPQGPPTPFTFPKRRAIEVQVIGSDGKPCKLQFRQDNSTEIAFLNGWTCPSEPWDSRTKGIR